ncbi:MAG TPA: hypothetical protein VH370_19535 [Humisphaera sp.]|nr:hypothetical protein [Humisphaera sp.]
MGIASSPIFAAPKTPAPTGPAVVYPLTSAAQPGTSVDITWVGDTLGQPIGMWTSFPATVTPLPAGDSKKRGQAKYRITLDKHVPAGIGAVRLLTSAGVSNLRLFLVDDLPSTPQHSGNHSVEQAQVVSSGVAIDGACEAVAADFYKLHASKGQRISAEVVAQRMGSKMDPMIRLLDSGGHELVYCDDSPGAGSDCRFAYAFAADGDYILEVRDVNYEGGAEYRYRLRVGDFPIISSVFPPVAKGGTETSFHLEGIGCETLPPISMMMPAEVSRAWLDSKFPSGQGSALASVLTSDLSDITESGRNDSPGAADRISVPGAANGHFLKTGAPHYFQFHADKGQKFSIRGLAREIGSPASVSLLLLKSDGTKLAESKVAGPEDASLEAAIPADGDYVICARELSGQGGPEMVYRIEIRPVQPGFSLSVESEQLNAAAGESVTLKVTAMRRDYNGPITLSLSGESSALELSNATIPAGKNEIELKIKAPAEVADANMLRLSIFGEADVNGVHVTEKASTLPALKKVFSRIFSPPAELDGMIGMGITSR